MKTRSSRPRTTTGHVPEFLIKTTVGCSVVVLILLIPFTVNNVIQERYLLALATGSVALSCAANAWYGFNGRYSLRLNSFVVCPAAAFTIIETMLKLGSPGTYWPFLLGLAYYFVLPQKRAWSFNVVTFAIVVPIAWTILDQSSAVRFSAVMLGTSLFAFFSMREIYALHDRLKDLAVRDDLTGLFNRVLLEDCLKQAIAQNHRTGVPMSALIFDVDHFKAVNDTLGHDKGDAVLRGIANLVRKRIRGTDRAFRIGGEEFLVLVHNTDERQAAVVAEDLRHRVESAALVPDRRVTISVGVSNLREDMDVATWIRTCDENLYRAKHRGRNQVVA